MYAPAIARLMKDGKRLHLQHGPSDLICEAWGTPEAVAAAYNEVSRFFETVLEGLVADLATLRQPAPIVPVSIRSPISKRMIEAANLFSDYHYVTPMAGVAGAIADAVLRKISAIKGIEKAYVNNGGDIAVYLKPDQEFKAAIVNNHDDPSWNGTVHIKATDQIGGIATSGWQGRSFSSGIADAVTVLASNAVLADVAATLIAGDVFVKSSAIKQTPVFELDPDSDLGDRLVTTDVGELTDREINKALSEGEKTAKLFQSAGLIGGVYISLKGEVRQFSQQRTIIRERVA
ncbi:UPF0280 family protein [Sneathiella limimaris]|uniref:UPF0280 family protein n=1 Tax=Sneathiella limimaris TaxID=1964213 RepID=UPI00146EB09E|nr:UPF0280 family protein [Sneathiella limimaris]